MSNHYLKHQAADFDPSKLQPGLASNPTYQLNELPADEVLRYSLANVTRVESARLRILLDESFEVEPEVTLTQSIIAAAVIVKRFVQDYWIVLAAVSFLVIGVAFYALAGVGSYLTFGGIR